MDERFVSLATIVRAAAHVPAAALCTQSDTSAPVAVRVPPVVPEMTEFAHADVVRECTLMRLAALEAFEASAARMLTSLACDVLARELLLGPADIAALVRDALAAFAGHEPVGIAVCAVDAERVQAGLPLRVDPSLAPGDLVVEVRDGAFESFFAFRLRDVLDRAALPGAR